MPPGTRERTCCGERCGDADLDECSLSSIMLQTMAIAPRDPDSGDPGVAAVGADVEVELVPAATTATDWDDMIV